MNVKVIEIHTWASKSPVFLPREGGGNTVHKVFLEFVLYYIRFDLFFSSCMYCTVLYCSRQTSLYKF